MTDPVSFQKNPSKQEKRHGTFLGFLLVAYVLSFGLPALVNPRPDPAKILGGVELWGFQAAFWAVLVLMALRDGSPIGLVTAPSNPLFLLAMAAVRKGRYKRAVVLSLCSISSMVGTVFFVPDQPTHDYFNFPGGKLAVGYYLWLACGIALSLFAFAKWLTEEQ